MVWLNLSPIPLGRRGVIPRSNDFYLSLLHVQEGGSESVPCEYIITYYSYFYLGQRISLSLAEDGVAKLADSLAMWWCFCCNSCGADSCSCNSRFCASCCGSETCGCRGNSCSQPDDAFFLLWPKPQSIQRKRGPCSFYPLFPSAPRKKFP